MWNQTVRVIRGLFYYGFPIITAVIGVYATYRSTQLDGSARDRAFVLGMALVLGTWAWTAARSHRRHTADVAHLEDANQTLAKRVRDLERRIDGVVQALEASGATAEILDALQVFDVPHRRMPGDDDAAQVIPLDPH